MCDTLYHYCSIDSFKAIIETKTLRLGDMTKSNDKKEIFFLWDNLDRIIGTSDLNNDVVRDLFDLSTQKDCTQFMGVCVSENGDEPYMWQAYAPAGVAIGFNKKKLEDWSQRIRRLNNTIAYYDNSFNIEQLSERASIFGRVEYYPNETISDFIRKKISVNDDNAFKTMFENSPFFKSDYWKQENEWRICIPIILGNDRTGVFELEEKEDIKRPRIIKKEYIDYNGSFKKAVCDVPFDIDMVESVTLSPNCDEKIVDIKSFLSSNDFGFMVDSVEYSSYELLPF